MTDGVAVAVERLEKVFRDEARGEVRAVDRVSFHCRAGEIFGLLGANGAGKTTTLRMIATLLAPTSGTATIAGHDVRDAPREARRAIGFHTATTALYPRLSVRETLAFFARVGGVPSTALRERVDALVERFDLAAFADSRVGRLSTGMRQRVAIARAVAHDPPVLVFDEPTAGLDVMAALDFAREMEALRDEGKALIVSTHVMSEAERICDRIGILDRGALRACGDLEALREQTGKRYLEDIFVAVAGGDGTR